MTLRLSTQGMYRMGMGNMLSTQSKIAQLRQQISSGIRLNQAKDDPVGMATAQKLDHLQASLVQFGKDSDRVDHRLRMEEGALGDANDNLTRARELAIEANKGGMSDSDRKIIANEINQIRQNLIDIANRDDGNGRKLFAGSSDGVTPFTDNNGNITYHGDDGRNNVEISPDVFVQDGDSGSAVFLRVRTGDGYSRGTVSAANTGSGVLSSALVTNTVTWGNNTYTVNFTAANAYEILDSAGNPLSPAVAGTWTNGDTIPPAAAGLGVEFKITGQPAAGDQFTIERAPNQDVFKTLQLLEDALLHPGNSSADNALRINAIGSGLADIATAQDHLLNMRTGVGARMSNLDVTSDERSKQSISMTETLSALRDTDYADAISQLNMQMLSLEAAQKVSVQMFGMSLFNKL